MVGRLLSAVLPKGFLHLKLRRHLTVRDRLRADQLRILLFADTLGPTAQINWTRPLSSARQAGACALWLFEEKQLERYAAKHSAERFRADLAGLVDEMQPDAIVVSRYGGASAAAVLNVAKLRTIPVIFHIDDNLLAVPKELGASKAAKYGAPERLAAIKLFLSDADLAYVSTGPLLQQLVDMGVKPRRSFVGDIAGGAEIVLPVDKKVPSDTLTIGYMGSSSHSHDLTSVVPVLERILSRYRHVRFELFGSIKMPEQLSQRSSSHHAAISNYDDFIGELAGLKWDIALAPLQLTEFNCAKTNTKWIECTAAGIPVVGSQHPVYADIGTAGGALLAGSEEEWYSALVDLIENSDRRQHLLRSAQALLRQRFTLGHLRRQVAEVLGRAGLTTKARKIL
jgi:glycosyltransferase involved in cell wall biosynthesis